MRAVADRAFAHLRVRLGLVVATAWVAGGCGAEPDRPETTIERQEYVAAYVEILQASAQARDSAAAVRRTSEILRRRGISREELAEFAARHADDPEYMASVWRQIEQRIQQPAPSDTLPEPSGSEPEGTRH